MQNKRKIKLIGATILCFLFLLGLNGQVKSQESLAKSEYKKTTCILDGSTKCKKPGTGCTTEQKCPGLDKWAKTAADVAKVASVFLK